MILLAMLIAFMGVGLVAGAAFAIGNNNEKLSLFKWLGLIGLILFVSGACSLYTVGQNDGRGTPKNQDELIDGQIYEVTASAKHADNYIVVVRKILISKNAAQNNDPTWQIQRAKDEEIYILKIEPPKLFKVKTKVNGEKAFEAIMIID